MNLSYAYQYEIYGGKLGIGFSVGVIQDETDGASIITQEPDPSIPSSVDKASGLDFGLGFFYRSEKLYLGFSSKHLNEPTISTSVDIINFKRHYYLTSGYIQSLNDKFDLKPSILIKTEGVTSTVDLTSLLEYNKKLWGGVTI